MTFVWNTDNLIEELEKIPLVKKIENSGPGGDFDTSALIVFVSGTRHALHVSGYFSTEEPISNPDLSPVRWVEITDGLDSGGGLKSNSKNLAEVYIKIRQYFLNAGVEVINHYDEIF